jgi:hypothetical protein
MESTSAVKSQVIDCTISAGLKISNITMSIDKPIKVMLI